MKISGSIVIYNEKKETLSKVINSFLSIKLDKELVIVDNSENTVMQSFVDSFNDTKYIHSKNNIGFGAGHNLAFNSLTKKSDMHMVLNPDIYFNGNNICNFLIWFSESRNISLAVPRVYYPNDILQQTIRKIPTPKSLIKRRLNINRIFDDFVKKDELQDIKFKDVSEIPFAHGCFFIFKYDVFEKLNGFDERFFMYMEDVDICIRAKEYGKVVVNPNYKIYHEYRKESSKSIKLLVWHIVSAIKFFIKHRKLNL